MKPMLIVLAALLLALNSTSLSVQTNGPLRVHPENAHPFNPTNNINGVDGDQNGDGKGIEIHQLAK
jgi:hypothetical protein